MGGRGDLEAPFFGGEYNAGCTTNGRGVMFSPACFATTSHDTGARFRGLLHLIGGKVTHFSVLVGDPKSFIIMEYTWDATVIV